MNLKNQSTTEEPSTSGTKAGLALIVAGLVLWGVFHALGTYFGGGPDAKSDWRKPVVVLVCSFSFLAFWGALLYFRSRRR